MPTAAASQIVARWGARIPWFLRIARREEADAAMIPWWRAASPRGRLTRRHHRSHTSTESAARGERHACGAGGLAAVPLSPSTRRPRRARSRGGRRVRQGERYERIAAASGPLASAADSLLSRRRQSGALLRTRSSGRRVKPRTSLNGEITPTSAGGCLAEPAVLPGRRVRRQCPRRSSARGAGPRCGRAASMGRS